jgi:hypothetical protein
MDSFQSFISGILRLTLRLLLLGMGLVFAASLLFVLLVFAVAWVLRAVWAKLTGQPVLPWVMRVDPRAGFSRFTQRPGARGAAAQGDVVDVEVRDVDARRIR